MFQTAIKLTQAEAASVFTEWARRYAADPAAFGPILDDAGKPVDDYGWNAAHYFRTIAIDMGWMK